MSDSLFFILVTKNRKNYLVCNSLGQVDGFTTRKEAENSLELHKAQYGTVEEQKSATELYCVLCPRILEAESNVVCYMVTLWKDFPMGLTSLIDRGSRYMLGIPLNEYGNKMMRRATLVEIYLK